MRLRRRIRELETRVTKLRKKVPPTDHDLLELERQLEQLYKTARGKPVFRKCLDSCTHTTWTQLQLQSLRLPLLSPQET